MTDEARKSLKLIVRDLMLWNNQYNNKNYLSVTMSENGYLGYSVDVNNNYWDEPKERFAVWFTEDELMNL